MLDSVVLDVVIGMMLIYWLLSSICSAINELIAATLATRARILEQEIVKLLDDPKLVESFYQHPLIRALFLPKEDVRPARRKPHYIEPKIFSTTLLDILTPGSPTFRAIRDEVSGADVVGVKQAIRALMGDLAAAEGGEDTARLQTLRKNIEEWYNAAMERLTGWYKRRTQQAIFFIALTVSLLFNIDTLVLVDHLSNDDALRAAVVASAQRAVADAGSQGTAGAGAAGTTLKAQFDALRGEFAALNLPVGWTRSARPSPHPADWFQKVVGLLLTTAALTMGAPFWFDVMSKLVNVRSAGKRPDTDRH
jgi:hypothetical protein